MKSVNPATNELIKEYEQHSSKEVSQKIEDSHKYFLSWSKLSVSDRTKKLLEVARLLEEHKKEFAKLMSSEMGKPLKESFAEVEKCAWLIKELDGHAASWLENEEIVGADGLKNYVHYEPLGPTYIIMPWNFPFWQVFKVALPPLVAGNTILLKHASNVTGSALAIEDLFNKAGLQGLLQTVLVSHSMSDEIIAHKKIAAVSLTGSEKAGSHVASLAAKHIKKSVLELGGSDAFIVCRDADIEAAAQGAVFGRFLNAGQVCIGAKRFLVHKDIVEEFTERFVLLTKQKKVADQLQEDTDIGPLVNEQAVNDMELFVQDAKEKGANIVLGGSRIEGDGCFFAPTIIRDVTLDMRVMTEETFGPIAPIIAFDKEEEAIEIANNTEFGLNASVWSQDLKKAEEIAKALHTGGVFINKPSASHPLIPLGGIKKSGFGRELGLLGIREFTNPKPINVYRVNP